MTFAPLHTLTLEGDPADNINVQQQQPCSPRSMYSLAAAVGISMSLFSPVLTG